MKKLIAAIPILFFSLLSHADIIVIPSQITGEAIQLPNGIIQIAYPGIQFSGLKGYRFLADEPTATTICAMLSKKTVSFHPDSGGWGTVVTFEKSGAFVDYVAPGGVAIIKILNCN